MNHELAQSRLTRLAALLLVSVALPLLGLGCGGKEETPPEAAEPPAPEGEKVPVEAAAAYPGAAPADVIPVTLAALGFMPAGAQVAVALPPVPSLIDTYMPLARALADPGDDLDAELRAAIGNAASEIGVQADTWDGLTAALGADPNAPVAVFVDFTRMVESAAAEKARRDSAGGDGQAPAGDLNGSEPAGEEVAGEPAVAPDYFANAEQPDWAVALGVTDPEKARAEIERVAAEDEDLKQLAAGTEVVDGVLVTTRGDKWGYFTTDKRIVLGSLSLVRGAANRVKNPATYRYGTVECPPRVAEEAIMVVHGNRVMPLWEQAMPLLETEGAATTLATAQLATYKNIFNKAGEDPMILTASLADGVFEIVSKADTATHHGLLDLMGQPTPLRLARLLPESTQALFSIRLNEATKKQLSEEAVPAAIASGDPSAAQGAAMAAQVITLLGDEITLGIGAGDGIFPTANAFVGLADPSTAKSLLAFVPVEAGPEIEGYAFGKFAPMPMLSIYLGIVDDMLLASTNEGELQTLIARHKAGELSPLFGKMDPPMAVDSPVYQTVVINSALMEKLQGMSALLSGGANPPDPTLLRITNAIREVRLAQHLEGTWFAGRLTVYLKDLEAALAASKAAAAQAPADGPEAEAPAAEAPAAEVPAAEATAGT